jgi:hypothetical protein
MTKKLEDVFDNLTCQQLRDIETAIENIYQARDVFSEINKTLKSQLNWKNQGDIESVYYRLDVICSESYISVLKEYIQGGKNE